MAVLAYSAYSKIAKSSLPLVQYNAAMYYNHSSMRKVHLVKGHVVNVYWIDAAYVQNNLPTEYSKRTVFYNLKKIY